MDKQPRWVLQICHGYDAPFMDCARQYAVLFEETDLKVLTVYLTGKADPAVAEGTGGDEVIFLEFSKKALRGLKGGPIGAIRGLAGQRSFQFCIAHRFKSMYVGLWATTLPVLGVCHAFGVYNRWPRRLLAGVFRRRLALLGVSDAVRDDLKAALPKGRIATFYNHIDVERTRLELFSRDQAREALALPAESWVVGNVGRLHPDKDQASLLKGFAAALPRLPDTAVLAIMGSGRLESRLKALSEELGIAERVRFLGQVKDGRRYFKAFDVFALSSDYEPFGMVLLEAMAAEVPLIASDCGGAAEVVRGCGALFPFADAGALADALVSLSVLDAEALSSLRTSVVRNLEERFSDQQARRHFPRLLEELGFTL